MNVNLFGVKTVSKGEPLWIDQRENFKFCLQYFLNGSLIAYSLIYFERFFEKFLENKIKDVFANIFCFILIIAGIYWDNTKCLINSCNGDSPFQPHYPTANLIWSLTLFLMLISRQNVAKSFFENMFFLQESGKLSFGIYLWHPIGNVFKKSHIRFKNYFSK